VAGIEDANPQLMSYAINKYYKKEDKEWYEVFVKDGSIQGVRTVLDQVKSLHSLYEDVQGTVSWDFNLNKNSL
jgi:pyocin large subunit-like protein